MPYKDREQKKKSDTNIKRLHRNKSNNQQEVEFPQEQIEQNKNIEYVLSAVIEQMMIVKASNVETVVRARAIGFLANIAKSIVIDGQMLKEAEELARILKEAEENE